jgi:hypothetical protein
MMFPDLSSMATGRVSEEGDGDETVRGEAVCGLLFGATVRSSAG